MGFPPMDVIDYIIHMTVNRYLRSRRKPISIMPDIVPMRTTKWIVIDVMFMF